MDKVEAMANYIVDDHLDLTEYLQEPETAREVRPASYWNQDLIASFNPDEYQIGYKLPWAKTHRQFRLRPAEVTLWCGINGHGKSICLNQIMLAVMAQGGKACIASLEMRPVNTLHRMAKQFVGTVHPADEYVDKFSRWTDDKLWIYNQTRTVKAEEILAVIRWTVDRIGIEHFVIDSLLKCGIASDDYSKQKWFVDNLTAIANDTGIHIHLIVHSRKHADETKKPGKFDIKGSGDISDMAHNVMNLWRNKRREQELKKPEVEQDSKYLDQPDAYLICDKQREGDWEGSIRLYFHESHQFLPNEKCAVMNDDDWINQRWY